MLQSSTCFEQYYAHPQEVKLHVYSIWYRHYEWQWWSYSTQVVLYDHQYNLCTVRPLQPLIESDDTICCSHIICPPEDEHNTARNM